ncbi:MAG: hypothetical protein ACJ77N_12205, partial [Chloroflexota bacterium]
MSQATLRRWSDDGRIDVFITPGGHRRYRRGVLEKLVPGDPAARPSLARSGMTPTRLVRAYRHEARAAADKPTWLTELDDRQRGWFRERGRRVAELLVRHLDAGDAHARDEALDEATDEASEYGSIAAGLGMSLSEAVEGFLRFRRPFLDELSLVARRRGFDTRATTESIDRAERAMDRLLIATMAAHRAAPTPRAAHRRPPVSSPASAGIAAHQLQGQHLAAGRSRTAERA